jgi:hypothetical protein
MIIDKSLQVSDAQAVTASAASTDVIDTGVANRSIGTDTSLALSITVDESATASGAATVTFSLQDSADNSTFADVQASAAIGKADLTAGKQPVLFKLPHGLRRYVRVYYTVATGPLTAGKFSAQIVMNGQRNVAYPDSL